MLATPLTIRLARATGILDAPGLRKVHGRPVPRLGGAAIAASTLIVIAALLMLDAPMGRAFLRMPAKVLAVLAGAILMFAIGLVDDIRGVRARVKLAVQVISALAVCAAGVQITSVRIGSLVHIRFGVLAWPITLLWIVGITNAVNLIDGLDGLAAGISAIACAVIATFALYVHQEIIAVGMLALLGSLLGFLVFNFHPAKTFMGNCGTYFLGFVLGAGSILSSAKGFTLVGLALPVLALGVPIFDTFFSIIRRICQRRSLMAPDRSHIHHRLLKMGLSQRHAVICMYAATALAAGLGMFMMITNDTGTLVVIVAVTVLLALLFRAVGAVRLRDSLAAIRRNLDRAHQAKAYRHDFEEAQLRLREAGSFADWWRGVCGAADRLEFKRLSLRLVNRRGDAHKLRWSNSNESLLSGGETLRLYVPVKDRRSGSPVVLKADVYVNGSLESASRRSALFGRLMEEHCLANLGKTA